MGRTAHRYTRLAVALILGVAAGLLGGSLGPGAGALLGWSVGALVYCLWTWGRLWPLDADAAFRVGEVERAAACDALAEHFAAGRLDPAELDDRLARAMAARSQGDLRVLFSDLRPRRAAPAETGAR